MDALGSTFFSWQHPVNYNLYRNVIIKSESTIISVLGRKTAVLGPDYCGTEAKY